MSNPKISIFTCSYNKPQYVQEAIDSVINQTYPNFEYIVIENSTDTVTKNLVHTTASDWRLVIVDHTLREKERKKIYAESYLKNKYTACADGDLIMYLADDDILEPNCFEEHIKDFVSNPSHLVNFHGWQVVFVGSNKPNQINAAWNRHYGLNTRRRPGRRVDGGAVMFNKKLLAQLEQPYFKLRWKDAHISDALFLNKLGALATFFPITKQLHTKRITGASIHGFVDNTGQPSAYRPGDFGNIKV